CRNALSLSLTEIIPAGKIKKPAGLQLRQEVSAGEPFWSLPVTACFVCFNDPGNQRVADDIGLLKVQEADPLDIFQDTLSDNQPGFRPARQVDLRLVTCNHHLRAEA